MTMKLFQKIRLGGFFVFALMGMFFWPRLVSGSGRGPNPQELIYGFAHIPNDQAAIRRFQVLTSALAKKLGRPVQIISVNDFNECSLRLATGQVDLVCIGPVQYIKVREQTGAEPLVYELSPGKIPGYYSILIASAKSKIFKLEDARGKVLAFGQRDSTSGALIPTMHFLQDLNVTPASFASQVVFALDHYEVIRGVGDGRFQIGATNDLDLDRFCRSEGLSPDLFRVVWKSALIPTGPYCVRKDLAPELKLAIKKAFLELNSEPEVLNQLQLGGFREVSDADYQIIREALKYLNY